MKASSKRRVSCLLCEGRRLQIALPLAATPIADDFVPRERLDQPQTLYPLDVALCLDCGHLQLLDAVDPNLLFGNYLYVSTSSPGLVEHFRQSAERLANLVKPAAGALALDIGSNDGTLLRFLAEKGFRVLGVDPAPAAARSASAAGVDTLLNYFGSALARRIRIERGPATLVTANNVFAHSETLPDMADGVAALLADDGLFVFEVAYLVDMIENMVFDSIYHEHLCYHSVKPLVSFLLRHGLELVDVERIEGKGGSLRCVAQKAGGARKVSPGVAELLALEAKLGLGQPKIFEDYAAAIGRCKMDFLKILDGLAAQGKTVAGYGASATVTTLLHHFDLGRRIAFLLDDNPLKQGLFSPGHHLEVLPSAALYERKPDCVAILAWRFAPMIIKKHQAYLDQGGRFIVPLPALSIVGT